MKCSEIEKHNYVIIVKPKYYFHSNTVTFYAQCLHVLICIFYSKYYSTNQNTVKLNATQLKQSLVMRADIDY